MKRMTYFVMALAMVLGFTQCKKDQTPANNQTEGVFITLDVNGGNNNSRVEVIPGYENPTTHEVYARVRFESGDVIYVGNAGAYCGYLIFNGTNFTGTVNPTSTADYLHFYFMGNKGPVGSAPSTVSITDQTVKYPVISYAHSKDLFDSDVHSYTAKLQNYCSIVKFTTNSIPTDTDITVKGMKNTVSVDFGANNAATSTSGSPYTFTKSGDGDIILHAVSTSERWAILLEQDAVNGATVTADGYLNSTCDVPVIANNTYHSTGVSISMTPTPTETTITWNSSIVNTINIAGNSTNNNGITVTSNSSNAKWNNSGGISTITLKSTSDKLTFSTADGTITKIIITLNPTSGSVEGTPSSGWTYVGLPDHTLTWTGSSSSVDLGCVSSKAGPGGFGGGGIGVETYAFEVSAITNVEFTVQQ